MEWEEESWTLGFVVCVCVRGDRLIEHYPEFGDFAVFSILVTDHCILMTFVGVALFTFSYFYLSAFSTFIFRQIREKI